VIRTAITGLHFICEGGKHWSSGFCCWRKYRVSQRNIILSR